MIDVALLDTNARAVLVAGAAAERQRRETHYPGMVAAGEIEGGHAEADIEAWRAIEAMLAIEPLVGGRATSGQRTNPRVQIGTDLPWEALELAASTAMIRLAERAEANPENTVISGRLDVVQTVHRWLVHERGFWAPGRAAA